MIEISSAIQGLRVAFDMISGAVEARDDAKIKAALTEANTKMYALSMAALASIEKASNLQAELNELHDELRAIKTKSEERDNYALAEVESGKFAYARSDGKQPSHYLCQPCFDTGNKSVLRVGRGAYGENYHSCPADGKHDF